MAGSIFSPEDRRLLLTRFARLTPQTAPKWGKMNVNQMVVHCRRAIEMMTGELKVAPKKGPFRNPLLRYLIIHVLPWPNGAPTAPELIPPSDPGEFQDNVAKLRASVEAMGKRDPKGPFAEHAAFGALHGRNLGALIHRHLDHHLRQFGT